MEPKELKIPVGNGVACKHWQSAGTPTVGVHGWLDNSSSFDFLAPLLKGLNFFALDGAGHGLSAHKAPDNQYHFIDWVPDTIAQIDHLGMDSFGAIGHSMGAAICSLIAGTIPDRLKFLVLIDGIAPLTGDPDTVVDRLKQRMRAEKKAATRVRPPYKSIDEALAARVAAGEFAQTERVRPIVERNLEKIDGGYQWRYDPKLRLPSSMRFTEDHVMAFLKAITCPTLVIRAKQGLPVNPMYAKKLLDCIEGVHYEELDGHHHLHLDRPEEVAKLINDFVASV
jgi:pimeloyl-ACP methyl ester carboxylesterase